MATQKELEGLVNRLNRVTGNAQAPWTMVNGKYVANPGNYHLDYAYGGVKLVQMQTDGGGIRNVTTGYDTKKVAYGQIAAYFAGVEDCVRAAAEHDAKVKEITG